MGTIYPLKFFNGGRALTSVLSKQPEIFRAINNKYGSQVTIVRDYYELHKEKVEVCDIGAHIGRSV